MNLAGGLTLAEETVLKEAQTLAVATAGNTPVDPAVPVGQDLPNLENMDHESLPAQKVPPNPDASSSTGNQHTFVEYGPPPDGPAPIQTITINPAEHTIGNWHIRPTFGTAFSYDDNIFISNVNPQGDFTLTISPGIAAGWGDFKQEILTDAPYEHLFQFVPDNLERRDYFFVRYAAHDNIFFEHSSQNGVDQDAVLDTQFEFSKLTLRLNAAIQTLSNADVQLGTRVHRTLDSANLIAQYPLSDKSSLLSSFAATSSLYQGAALDATEISNREAFNFTISPKINGSIAARFSYLEVQDSLSQVAEKLLLRAVFRPGAKLTIDATAGVEFRQVLGGQSLTEGVYKISGSYQPFDGTSLELTASRYTDSSPDLGGQDETITSVDAGIRQRLFQKFYLIVSTGYSHNVYRDILTLATQRKDDYTYVRPRIMFDINRWASLQFSFEFKNNQSTSSFGFIDHTAMVQCDIVF